MNVIQYKKDNNNIVHLVMDRPDSSANIMDEHFHSSFSEAVAKIESDQKLAGVIISSAKPGIFMAGGDLNMLYRIKGEDRETFCQQTMDFKKAQRRLETLGIPVVAAINGAALGGGWEIALGCHHRICLDNSKIKLGLPEVTLGLLPGAGGVVRMTRLLGLEAALPLLLEGRQFSPDKAIALGLIQETGCSAQEVLDKASAWIIANPGAGQVWDQKGYKVPGGTPASPQLAKKILVMPALLKNKTKGCYPAPEAILCAAVEGLQVDIDNALAIEARYFAKLVTDQVAKNMINVFWTQMNEIRAGNSRPTDLPKANFDKVGILGAGMMGTGIAYACATKGIQVVLKDINIETAEQGKGYTEKLLNKRISRGRLSETRSNEILARIVPTISAEDLQGCDLVIEAIFENRELKGKVTEEAERQLSDSALFASNTSTLPITGLAEASSRPQNFIGLHFFSPVDKMQLVEIICGDQTSDETLARAFDFVQQIGKVPIVVNDSRGFFTSRVFGTFVSEGQAMLGEGIAAASIENAALLAGFPVGPLAITDEVNMNLVAKVRAQTIADLNAEGQAYSSHPGDAVVDWMLEQNRPGKLNGAGFYEYPRETKKFLWPELKRHFFRADAQLPLQELKDRLLFIKAIETVRCLDEEVLASVRDANIGSILGIGYPGWTGGVLQFINQYGLPEFVHRARQLADAYGERFEPPATLLEMAERGETFHDDREEIAA